MSVDAVAWKQIAVDFFTLGRHNYNKAKALGILTFRITQFFNLGEARSNEHKVFALLFARYMCQAV